MDARLICLLCLSLRASAVIQLSLREALKPLFQRRLETAARRHRLRVARPLNVGEKLDEAPSVQKEMLALLCGGGSAVLPLLMLQVACRLQQEMVSQQSWLLTTGPKPPVDVHLVVAEAFEGSWAVTRRLLTQNARVSFYESRLLRQCIFGCVMQYSHSTLR